VLRHEWDVSPSIKRWVSECRLLFQLLWRAQQWLLAPLSSTHPDTRLPRWLSLLLIDSWTSRYVMPAIDNDSERVATCALIDRAQVWSDVISSGWCRDTACGDQLRLLSSRTTRGDDVSSSRSVLSTWSCRCVKLAAALQMREVAWFHYRSGKGPPSLYGIWLGPLSVSPASALYLDEAPIVRYETSAEGFSVVSSNMRPFVSALCWPDHPVFAQLLHRVDRWLSTPEAERRVTSQHLLDSDEEHLYEFEGGEGLKYAGTADHYPCSVLLPASDMLWNSPWEEMEREDTFADEEVRQLHESTRVVGSGLAMVEVSVELLSTLHTEAGKRVEKGLRTGRGQKACPYSVHHD